MHEIVCDAMGTETDDCDGLSYCSRDQEIVLLSSQVDRKIYVFRFGLQE